MRSQGSWEAETGASAVTTARLLVLIVVRDDVGLVGGGFGLATKPLY